MKFWEYLSDLQFEKRIIRNVRGLWATFIYFYDQMTNKFSFKSKKFVNCKNKISNLINQDGI